jgi:hypothetical protein
MIAFELQIKLTPDECDMMKRLLVDRGTLNETSFNKLLASY